MKVVYRFVLLWLSSLCSAHAQLPFFLHRFLPKQQHGGLLQSGSVSIPSFFPSSSSFLSAASSPHFFGSSSIFSNPSFGSTSSHSFGSTSSNSFGSGSSHPFGSTSSNSFGSGSSHPFGSSSNLAHSLVDFGTVGQFEGLGGFDQAELLDDYPGFSNVGFAKDLNFAGSHPFRFHSSPSSSSSSFTGDPQQLYFLQQRES